MTHQPIEQLSSLELIPNLYIYRPFDVNELIASYKDILANKHPSVLVLPRENKEISELTKSNKVENGAYILNKTDSIEIMVQVEKNGDYFLMEAFAVLGMSNFTIEWGEDEFSCEKVEYHENGKISKMIFGIIK